MDLEEGHEYNASNPLFLSPLFPLSQDSGLSVDKFLYNWYIIIRFTVTTMTLSIVTTVILYFAPLRYVVKEGIWFPLPFTSLIYAKCIKWPLTHSPHSVPKTNFHPVVYSNYSTQVPLTLDQNHSIFIPQNFLKDPHGPGIVLRCWEYRDEWNQQTPHPSWSDHSGEAGCQRPLATRQLVH